MARAEIAAGNLETAEDSLRDALRVADEGGSYARAFRLHQLLAEALRLAGDAEGAADALDRAREGLSRVRNHLDDDLRDSFDRLPEVRELLAGMPRESADAA